MMFNKVVGIDIESNVSGDVLHVTIQGQNNETAVVPVEGVTLLQYRAFQEAVRTTTGRGLRLMLI